MDTAMTPDLIKLRAAWSCDTPLTPRNSICRNPHGCHCREITSLKDALEAAEKRIAELEGENADLKISVVAFAGPVAVEQAKLHGLKDGELRPSHFNLLKRCGARMADFKRASQRE